MVCLLCKALLHPTVACCPNCYKPCYKCRVPFLATLKVCPKQPYHDLVTAFLLHCACSLPFALAPLCGQARHLRGACRCYCHTRVMRAAVARLVPNPYGTGYEDPRTKEDLAYLEKQHQELDEAYAYLDQAGLLRYPPTE